MFKIFRKFNTNKPDGCVCGPKRITSKYDRPSRKRSAELIQPKLLSTVLDYHYIIDNF